MNAFLSSFSIGLTAASVTTVLSTNGGDDQFFMSSDAVISNATVGASLLAVWLFILFTPSGFCFLQTTAYTRFQALAWKKKIATRLTLFIMTIYVLPQLPGRLDYVNGNVNIQAGAGTHKLMISDRDSPVGKNAGGTVVPSECLGQTLSSFSV